MSSTRMGAALRPWLLLLGLAPTAAWATSNFPEVLQQELALPSAPSCSLCHQGPEAVGTVVTPFGTSMRQRGLVLYDDAALRSALGAMLEQAVDSDGDGTPDLDELRAGEDPNRVPPGAGEVELLEPRYGCSSTGGGAVGAALLLLLVLARSRGLRTRMSSVHAVVPTRVDTSRGGRTSFRASGR
ncbi:MAG: thrombospondin type 3 repeat-containing protein [Myxococcaceae bacterium]|nr:thrombospondin type 3 repeat-containing protein [Myxococcaceae bacterium]MCI0673868.1 thrombospondin type 3 repeat-containing protein [Myxococcaceae bacterium]